AADKIPALLMPPANLVALMMSMAVRVLPPLATILLPLSTLMPPEMTAVLPLSMMPPRLMKAWLWTTMPLGLIVPVFSTAPENVVALTTRPVIAPVLVCGYGPL